MAGSASASSAACLGEPAEVHACEQSNSSEPTAGGASTSSAACPGEPAEVHASERPSSGEPTAGGASASSAAWLGEPAEVHACGPSNSRLEAGDSSPSAPVCPGELAAVDASASLSSSEMHTNKGPGPASDEGLAIAGGKNKKPIPH